jgi:DHA1 family tetracycline resistance protein-like MFS transporter
MASRPPKSLKDARSKSTLAILFGVIIIDLIGVGIVLPILPYYADMFGASGTVLGLLLATHAAMQFLFSPVWGKLSDRIGRRPVMLITIAGTALSLYLLGMAQSLAWLFVARALSGFFSANISVAVAYLTDVTDESERTHWMGMIGASFSVGFILGPALGGLLAPYGLGVPMYTAAGMAAINFLYAVFALREPEERANSEGRPPKPSAIFKDRVVAQLCLTNFLFTLGVCQFESMFAYLMKDLFDWDASQVAWILVMMGLWAAIIQATGLRGLASRFGERALLATGVLWMALAYPVVPHSWSIGVMLVPLAVMAVGRAIAQSPMISLVSMRAARDTRGATMGTFQSAASLARVAGPMIAGVLYDASMPLPFYLAGALFGTSFVLTLRLKAGARQPEISTLQRTRHF